MINRRNLLLTLTTTALALPFASRAKAGKLYYTIVTVDNMHCATCANKIARKIYAVPGVVKVKTDVAKNTAWITPQQTIEPSPRKVWEAVEQAGFKPLKIQTQHGVFTEKPRA